MIVASTWYNCRRTGNDSALVDYDPNSDTFDSILDLSLDINNALSVKDGLKKFTAVDTLRGTNKYKCEK